MGEQAKLSAKTLGLLSLVLLPFAAHIYFAGIAEYRPPQSGEIADLIAAGHYARAYRLLQYLDLSDSTAAARARAQLQMALCERRLGEAARAYARLRQGAHALPVLEEYRRFWMARSLEDMDERQGAIAAYEDFLLACENPLLESSARQHLASLYRESGRHQQALDLYRRQMADHPDTAPQTLYLMASTYGELGQRQARRDALVRLMEAYPASRQALQAAAEMAAPLDARQAYAVASTYFHHRRYAEASRRLQRFARAHPRDQRIADAYYLLGRAQLGNGQLERAQQTFARVAEQYERPSALYRIGGILVRRNREEEAIATYERFAQRYPRHELADDALWQAAKAAERNDDFAAAEKYYRQLVERHPDSQYREEAGWSIGFTYYCRRQYRKALVVFERLSALAAQVHIIDQSLYWAGKAAGQLGRERQAAAYYRRAAAGFPRSYYSARAVALGYGDPGALARPPLAGRKAASPIEGAEHLRRGEALYELGLRQLALAELQQAERRNQDDVDNLRIVRDRYEALGYLDRALRLSMRIFASDGARGEWHRLYPNYYWEEIVAAAGEAKVDPYLVLSVIRQESTFNQSATSRAGALGLMQIMPRTARTLAHHLGMRHFEREALYDPEVSIRLGSYFLGDQVRQFAGGDAADMGFELGLAAYNAGPHNARKWLERFPHDDTDAFVERIPFKETRLYVKLVLKNYAIYKALSDV